MILRRGLTSAKNLDGVAAPDDAGSHDPRVEAAQPQLAAAVGVDEVERLLAEASEELLAPGVRLGGHLDDGVGADAQPRAGGQVGVRQVEVDVQLVARKSLLVGV